jgi:hypothetical protein
MIMNDELVNIGKIMVEPCAKAADISLLLK